MRPRTQKKYFYFRQHDATDQALYRLLIRHPKLFRDFVLRAIANNSNSTVPGRNPRTVRPFKDMNRWRRRSHAGRWMTINHGNRAPQCAGLRTGASHGRLAADGNFKSQNVIVLAGERKVPDMIHPQTVDVRAQ